MSAAVSYARSEDLPVVADADVIVIGGGPGGIAAAVAAARSGVRTLLVERYGFLGGMASAGEVHPFMGSHAENRPLDRPVYVEWIERMRQYEPPSRRTPVDPSVPHADRKISKDAAMLAAEDLVVDAGAQILYHHALLDAIRDGDRITAAVLVSKSGLVAVTGTVFIDSTGDGDLAALADCEFEQGGPTGHCQPMTTCFKLAGVDRTRMPDRKEINAKYQAAKDRGDLVGFHREDVLIFDWLDDDVLHFNSTRVIHKSGVDGVELSEAEIEGRRQVRGLTEFLRREVPGFEEARIHSIAHHIGIRETRRVLGRDYITRDTFVNRTKYEDAICRCSYPVDIHAPDGGGTELIHMKPNEYYEIPYGCLVVRDAGNLLMGCRAISVDHALHSSARVMPPVMSIGQAAGIAAAMAVQADTTPGELDGTAVRAKLVEFGANL